MSDAGWFELSQLLVDASPNLRSRLLKTLHSINADEYKSWQIYYRKANNGTSMAGGRCSNEYTNCSDWVMDANPHSRFYTGKLYPPKWKLPIKFVDSVEALDFILDSLKVKSLAQLML